MIKVKIHVLVVGVRLNNVGKLTNPYKKAQLDVIKREDGPNSYRMTLQNMDYKELQNKN